MRAALFNELFAAVSSVLTEAPVGTAAAEAKRRGFKSIGFGRYVLPQDPKTVIAKVENGKLVLTQHGAKAAQKLGQKTGKPAPGDHSTSPVSTAPTEKPINVHPHGRGRTTPSPDSAVKDKTLTRGWERGANYVAPGNPASALNEILTGEGIHRLRAQPELVKDPDALADLLEREYGKTALGQQNQNLREKLDATARSAISEYQRLTGALRKQEWDPRKVKVDHFWGSSASMKSMLDRIEVTAGKGKKFVTPMGQVLPAKELTEFVRHLGSLTNPADTAMFAEDTDGTTMVFFTSNKLSVADTVANAHPVTEIRKAKSRATNLVVNGVITEKQGKVAHQIIDAADKQLARVESDVGTMVIESLSSHVLKSGKAKAGFLKNLLTPKENAIEEKGRKSNLRRWTQFKQKLGLKHDGQAVTKFFQMLQNKELPAKGVLTTDDVGKLMSRSLHGVPGIPSAQQITATMRGKTINAFSNLRKSLNKIKTKTGKGLGDTIEAQNIIETFHLESVFGE